MQCKFLLLMLMFCWALPAWGGKTLVIDYQYSGDHGLDFNELSRGPLKVAEFSDGREGMDPSELGTLVTNNGEEIQYVTQKPLPTLVRDAIVQSIESGGGTTVSDGEKLLITGEVIETILAPTDSHISLTLRVKLGLENNSKSLWESTLFSKVRVEKSQGVKAAVAKALDRLIEELMFDDYFVMEIID